MKKLDMFPHGQKGLLITFCGLDGCGKTTQIENLKDWMQELGVEPYLTKQPTPFVRQSAIFRNYMDQPSHSGFDYRSLSLLAASDRVQHSNQVIYPLLEQGEVVISDRYFYSCIANLRARGYREDQWIYEVSGFIPKPDLAFFLDIDVETAVKRVRSRAEEKGRYIDMALQSALREEYLQLAKMNGGIVLRTAAAPEETFCQIQSHVMRQVAVFGIR